MRFKSSAEMVGQLNRYLVHLENHLFVAPDLVLGFKISDPKRAEAQLKRLEELLNGLAAQAPQLQGHFGRSKVGTGSHAFKCNWGFQPSPLVYQFRLARGRPTSCGRFYGAR